MYHCYPINLFSYLFYLSILRVQQEFERDYMQDVDKEGYEAKMRDPNLSAEEKKKEKDLFEDLEMKARRRSLG